MKHKISIGITSKVPSRLLFVKTIKEATGLGLREAKDICDYLCDNMGKYKIIEILPRVKFGIDEEDTYSYLSRKLPECGGEILLNGGIEWQRDVTILKLGMGETQEYVDILSDNIMNFRNQKLLKKILAEIEKDKLVQYTQEIPLLRDDE